MVSKYVLIAIALLAFWYFFGQKLNLEIKGETTSRALLPNTDQSREVMSDHGYA